MTNLSKTERVTRIFIEVNIINFFKNTDTTLNVREDFGYDRFNRLTSARIARVNGALPNFDDSFNYGANGNISQKERVGVYDYEHATNPYAVTSLSPDASLVDHLADQYVAYTPFDKLDTIRQNGDTLTVYYGIDRQRVTQSLTDGKDTRTKRYFTSLYETVTENGVTKKTPLSHLCHGIIRYLCKHI